MQWSDRTDWETVCRRASGRRHYNAVRHLRRDLRRRELLRLWSEAGGVLVRGSQKRVAAALGVHPSTISRDLVGILRPGEWEQCPVCSAKWLTSEKWDDLDQAIEAALEEDAP